MSQSGCGHGKWCEVNVVSTRERWRQGDRVMELSCCSPVLFLDIGNEVTICDNAKHCLYMCYTEKATPARHHPE